MATIRWPAAVYFDASILCRLPADLASPDLVRLTEAATKYDIGRFIPAIAKEEWLFFHEENARKEHERIATSSQSISRYLTREFRTDQLTQEELAEAVRYTQALRLEAAGLAEIPTPAVPLEELINLAIRRVKPFSDKDRGFRDTLIVRTIAEHAKTFAGLSILVVSADDVFGAAEVRRQWESAGVLPLVAKTLEEAVGQLEAQMDNAYKKYLNQEAQGIKAFLVERQREIFERLKDAEVSETFIMGQGLGGLLAPKPVFGTLEKIRQVRPVEITRVSRGHVLGPHATKDGRVPVTFYVKVAFDISVRVPSLGQLFGGGPRIRLADAVDLPVPRSDFFSLPVSEAAVEDITVEREIPVKAWVVEDAGGKYVGLKIEEASAW